MEFLNANNASSLLTAAIGTTDTTVNITVGSGDRFPQPMPGSTYFVGTLSSGGNVEIVSVTDRVNDTLTIVRAQEGTTAQAWHVATRFEQLATAGQLQGMVQRVPVSCIKNLGSGGGSVTLDLSDQKDTTLLIVEMTAGAPITLAGITGVQLKTVVVLTVADGSSPIDIPVDTPPFLISNISGPLGWPGTPLDTITLIYASSSATYKWLEVGRNWRVS